MGYYQDVYSSPGKHGLKILSILEEEDMEYEFNMFVAWLHEKSKKVYVGHDSGCSCPSPFENTNTLADLVAVTNSKELRRLLNEWKPSNMDSVILDSFVREINPYLES